MSNSNAGNSRRDFLKISGLGLLGAAALGTLTLRTAPAGAADAAKAPMVDPNEPLAKSLGYVTDATKVDTKKWSKRAGPEGKIMFCQTCNFYNDGKATTDATASCTLFKPKHVMGKGWCNSWIKNPNAKPPA